MNQKTKNTIAIILLSLLAIHALIGLISIVPSLVTLGINSVILSLAAKIFCLFPIAMSIVLLIKKESKKIAKVRFFIIYAVGTYMAYTPGLTDTGANKDTVGIIISIVTVVIFLITLFKFIPGNKMELKTFLGPSDNEADDEEDENTEEE